MPRFVSTSEGMINLDLVATMRTESTAPYEYTTHFWDARGNHIGTDINGDNVWNEYADWNRTIVPAAPGQTAILISVDDTGALPVAADVFVLEVPVFAWSIGELAKPVFVEQPPVEATVLIPTPDGHLIEPYVGLYRDLAEAKAEELADAQDRWRREHPEAKDAGAL